MEFGFQVVDTNVKQKDENRNVDIWTRHSAIKKISK